MKKYPLSYTFAWAADAEILFFENIRWKSRSNFWRSLKWWIFFSTYLFFILCFCLRVQTLVSFFGTTVTYIPDSDI